MKVEIQTYLKGISPVIKKQKDAPMNFCIKCKTVWEYWWQSGSSFFRKYKDMPTYGLERKTCNECKLIKDIKRR